MGVPRVFISSTCYDLSEVRDRLVAFCNSFGFETTLSERGDVFYHPDLHTHEACVGEVSNCQLFILIIGGRFGGKYIIDPKKSITNAEFLAARELGIPVFTFIKQGVLNDHNVYQRNKKEDFAEKINYPSIEKQEHAKSIFSFIDEVRLSKSNNGFFDFVFAKDIEILLRKQLAGMFFDFLIKRNISAQLKSTNEAISNLTIASKKIEELVKTIYRHVDEAKADDVIERIDEMSNAAGFFQAISEDIDDKRFVPDLEELINDPPDNWVTFLLNNINFIYADGVKSTDGRETDIIYYGPNGSFVADVDGDMSRSEIEIFNNLKDKYASFLLLPPDKRRKVMEPYFI